MDLIKHGPTVVEAVHVGEPTLDDPKRVLAPDITKQNVQLFETAVNVGRPPAPAPVVTPTGVNEPPRSDQPSAAPLQMQAPGEGTGVGVQIVSAPNGAAGAPANPTPVDPNALVKPVVPQSNALPSPDAPAEAPNQVNDIKPGENPTPPPAVANGKTKKPKVDQSDESSSKKKKKKGLGKLNPF
jgi:outer membrane protein assembly factor BamD